MNPSTQIIKANRRTTAEEVPQPPTPKWVPFFLEVPGDGQGDLLISLQLIHTGSPLPDLPAPPSIVPKTRVVGARAREIFSSTGVGGVACGVLVVGVMVVLVAVSTRACGTYAAQFCVRPSCVKHTFSGGDKRTVLLR